MTPTPRDTWIEDGLTFTELIAQPYSNCVFAAGGVDGHPVDTIYLRWERDGDTERMIMLRPDEAAAIIQVLSGALWSALIEDV